MKKLSLLVALALLITVGGVYATWTYTQSTDIADKREATTINMGNVQFVGTYGTYDVNTSTLNLVVEPKTEASHITTLQVTGEIVITFTPNTVAPTEVKANGVATTYTFGVSNPEWKYEGTNILAINSTAHTIGVANSSAANKWTYTNGVFTYTIGAAEIAGYIDFEEFNLDTKAKYDAFDLVLENGQVTIAVSDGQHTGSTTP